MRAIVLFARAPEREAAAKRLPGTAPLFRSLVAAWLRAAHEAGATPFVASDARDREALAAIEPALGREWIEQRGSRFGERVATAVGEAFARGCTSVVVAAIDAPPPALDDVFTRLEQGSAVIAPSRDGGINFLGITAPEAPLLVRFTPRRRDLVRLCRDYFDHLVVLDSVTDVDSAAALEMARRERAWQPYLTAAPPPIHRTAPAVVPVVRRMLPSRAPPLR